MIGRRTILAGLAAAPLAAHAAVPLPRIGGIVRLDPAMDDVVAADSPIEVLGSGYVWAEGPVWVPPSAEHAGFLLFSDVPSNIVHRWQPGSAVQPFLDPSGHARPVPETIREGGSNGLAIDPAGRLLMADSGNRAIVRMDLRTRKRTTLASHFEGKRLNSPNDLTIADDGSIWFTDPPYGLRDAEQSPLRELDFNGLYRLAPDGRLTAVDRGMHRPNGVALSPDGRTLYVAMSDEARPQILSWALGADGLPTGPARIFHDFSEGVKQKLPGLPDGLKCDREGRVYATGPGGVTVLDRTGRVLGLISTGGPIANCGFGEDGRTLFLTAWKQLARVRLKASGW